MNWLNQLFFGTGNGFVATLFADILRSPIGSVIYYLNISISIITIFFICQQIVSRALKAGEDGRLHGITALAIRLSIIPLFCFPVVAGGKLSLAQLATLKIAEAGSNFGDFLFSKMPPLREAIPLSLSSSHTASDIPKVSYISADAAATVGKIYSLRFCQLRLVWLDSTYALPSPTITKTIAGEQIVQFGAPIQMRLPADTCGSISFPPSAAELENNRIARALNTFSSTRVTDSILESHRVAINSAITESAGVLQKANPHAGLADPSLWSQIATQMRSTAAKYESSIALAGGAIFVKNDGSQPNAGAEKNLGWLRAGFTLSTRASQISGRISALTWRPTIHTQDVAQIYPLRFSPDQYLTVDQQFLNALQSAGLTKIPQGAGAGGLGVESFLGVGEIRVAAELMSNPHADIFEVSAAVGPLLTAAAVTGLAAYTAVSAIFSGIGPFVSAVTGTLALAGQGLTITVQIAPAIAWTFLLLGWFSNVIILFISVSFFAVGLARESGDEIFLTGKIADVFARAVTILFAPALLTLGLALVVPIINLSWYFVVSSIVPAISAAASESVIASAISMIIIVLFVITLISKIIYFSISKIAGTAKFVSEILETHAGALSVGEQISGGETVSTGPGLTGGSGARQPGPAGAPGAGGQVGLMTGGRGNAVDKNAQHVSIPTRGSPK